MIYTTLEAKSTNSKKLLLTDGYIKLYETILSTRMYLEKSSTSFRLLYNCSLVFVKYISIGSVVFKHFVAI